MNEHRSIVGRPFPKGQSGNPGGRPKELRGIVELARARSADAVETLASIMLDKEAPPAVRVAAANAILDRAYGRPAQAVIAEINKTVTLEDLLLGSYGRPSPVWLLLNSAVATHPSE